jgi:hypothetical protein
MISGLVVLTGGIERHHCLNWLLPSIPVASSGSTLPRICVLLVVTGDEQQPPCSISALYDEVVARGPPADDDMSMWAQMTRIKV